MNTAIDISGKDPCAFVSRYGIQCKVFERLIALKWFTSTIAEALLNSLKQVLTEVGILIENFIADMLSMEPQICVEFIMVLVPNWYKYYQLIFTRGALHMYLI